VKPDKVTYIKCPHCGEQTPAVERCLRCNEDFVLAGLDQTDSYRATDILESTRRYNTLPGEAYSDKYQAIIPKDDLEDVVFTGSEPEAVFEEELAKAVDAPEGEDPETVDEESTEVVPEEPNGDRSHAHRSEDPKAPSLASISEEEVVVFRPERETDSHGAIDPDLAQALADVIEAKSTEVEARAEDALLASTKALTERRAKTAITDAVEEMGKPASKFGGPAGKKRIYSILAVVAVMVLAVVLLLQYMTPEMEQSEDEPPLGDIPGFYFVSD